MAQDGRKPFIRYSFFKVDPYWRRLPGEERGGGKAQFAAVVDEMSSQLEVHSYNLMGTRGDTEFMLWQLAPSLESLQDLASGLYATGLGKYLSTPYAYLAMSRPSAYIGGHSHSGQSHQTGVIEPRGDPYLFVYPFVKTHDWYQLPKEERQRIMNQHFTIGHSYPKIKVHTSYSFGIDDNDFVLAFEGDSPEEFLKLVMELRESEARPYTLKDIPIFTCVRSPLKSCLDSLG
jgi:chlorite dismutase